MLGSQPKIAQFIREPSTDGLPEFNLPDGMQSKLDPIMASGQTPYKSTYSSGILRILTATAARIWAFSFLIYGCVSGQTSLKCHPPRIESHALPVFSESGSDSIKSEPLTFIAMVAADGELMEADCELIPDRLRPEVESCLTQTQFSPAKNLNGNTLGSARLELDYFLVAESGEYIPARPRFLIETAVAEKFTINVQSVLPAWVRVYLKIDRKGKIRQIQANNQKLNAVVEEMFNDLSLSHPPFEPARTPDGETVESHLILHWNATLPTDRETYKGLKTETISRSSRILKEDSLPEQDLELKIAIFPTEAEGVVTGAFARDHSDTVFARLLLQEAIHWYIPKGNRATPIEATFEFKSTEKTLTPTGFRPIPVEMPTLIHNPRPDYPKKFLGFNRKGFVKAAFTITETGETEDIGILESSETRFEPAALKALRKWFFQPMRFDQQPIPSRADTMMLFRPPDK